MFKRTNELELEKFPVIPGLIIPVYHCSFKEEHFVKSDKSAWQSVICLWLCELVVYPAISAI